MWLIYGVMDYGFYSKMEDHTTYNSEQVFLNKVDFVLHEKWSNSCLKLGLSVTETEFQSVPES